MSWLALEHDELPPTPPVEEVRARLDDWRVRIGALYDDVRRWMPAGLAAEIVRTQTMRAPLMEMYEFPAEHLPILDVRREGDLVASFVPAGLWVLPTNGQIEVWRGRERVYLIDKSEPLEGQSRWVLLDPKTRLDQPRVPFDEAVCRALLGPSS